MNGGERGCWGLGMCRSKGLEAQVPDRSRGISWMGTTKESSERPRGRQPKLALSWGRER